MSRYWKSYSEIAVTMKYDNEIKRKKYSRFFNWLIYLNNVIVMYLRVSKLLYVLFCYKHFDIQQSDAWWTVVV